MNMQLPNASPLHSAPIPWLPLKGLRVLELSQVMAGPVTGLMLADLGADVVKVEKLAGGDDARGYNSKAAGDMPASFEVLNRGKRSLALDLKSDEGCATLKRLAESADVVTENFRAGTMDKLGLGPSVLLRINPRLIYCSITGYGRWGPLSQRGGFDLVLQAFSGLISITGEADRSPVKPGVSIADVNAGILGALGVLGAYIHILRGGSGQHVETSLLQASMQQLYWYAALFFSGGTLPGRLGTAHPIIAPYQTYRCADGELALGGANETNWKRIAQVIGRHSLVSDPRFESTMSRVANRAALTGELERELLKHSRAHWEEVFASVGVPAGPVQTVKEALNHPQTQAMDILVETRTAAGGTRSMLGLPLHFSGTNAPATSAAPALGQHSSEVLREYGFSEHQIERLLDQGCLRQLAIAEAPIQQQEVA